MQAAGAGGETMMRRHRRSAVAVMRLAAVALAAIAAGSARAQTVYPERVIKMIVPAPAGGQTDVMARLMAQKMQQSLGQSVIIENRAGAGGALGARTAAAAEPDGYTLFYGNTSTLAVIPAVSKNAGYDPGEELRAGRKRVGKLHDPGRASLVPGQDHPGVPGLCQGQSRQAQLCPCRRRQRDASDRRDVPHTRRHRLRQRAAQGRNESVQSVLGNQVDFALESPVILLPADQGGKAQGARGHEREAAGGDCRCSDHGRERDQRFRGDAADRRRGAGRHARRRSSASSTA